MKRGEETASHRNHYKSCTEKVNNGNAGKTKVFSPQTGPEAGANCTKKNAFFLRYSGCIWEKPP
jgi:hypothetical protein